MVMYTSTLMVFLTIPGDLTMAVYGPTLMVFLTIPGDLTMAVYGPTLMVCLTIPWSPDHGGVRTYLGCFRSPRQFFCHNRCPTRPLELKNFVCRA